MIRLDEEEIERVISRVNFRDGLVVAIAQDHKTKEILMVAFMNEEALRKTLRTGRMHYWSRSRRRVWMKGETSGHIQEVIRARIDCDGDAIIFEIAQRGGACHEGYYSCFFRDLVTGEVVSERVFDPEEVYGSVQGKSSSLR